MTSGSNITLSVSCSRGTTPRYFPFQSSSFHKQFSTKLILHEHVYYIYNYNRCCQIDNPYYSHSYPLGSVTWSTMDAPGSKTLLLVARIGRREGRSRLLFPLLDMLLLCSTMLGLARKLENTTPMHYRGPGAGNSTHGSSHIVGLLHVYQIANPLTILSKSLCRFCNFTLSEHQSVIKE